MPPFVNFNLAGWGNYSSSDARVYRPEKLADVQDVVAHAAGDGVSAQPSLIARGLGRSYGDSATNAGGGVLLATRLDHLIDFDDSAGVVEAEAGVSLETLIDLFLPRGWFLPVTPGTKFVTLGGAIAADVHGKNHHVDGTIGNFVESLRLLTADGETLTCSPAENADVFHATVGGMGLTGIILSARLRLLKVPSAYVEVEYRRAANLTEALDLFDKGGQRKYSVGWIDCLAAGPCLGRCVIMEADHLPADKLPKGSQRKSPLTLPRKRRKRVPPIFPSFFLSRLAVKVFNKAYYARHGDGTRIVDFETFFYPLDSVRHWNRIYGRRGFVQYQALLPIDSARRGLTELLEKIGAAGSASFLAVLKRTGEQGPGMLSFPFPGYTLALDLKNDGEKLKTLVRDLDEIVLKHGGRLYLAKDSLMSADTFAKMYPRLDEFRQVKQRVDPDGKFSSTQSRRVGI